jgi:DNA-binding NtrC family response regulator
VLRFLLQEESFFAVAEAATMAEAAAYLPTVRLPHIVLLDFRNPHGDADILLRLVEWDAALQRHRYILMPASHITRFSEEAQRLINAICAEVVYKPFDVENILTAVERAEAHLHCVGQCDELPTRLL